MYTVEKIQNALLASQGKRKATLRIDNVQIADLYNGEFFIGSLCVYEDIIIGYKYLEAESVIDAKGAYILPNFMDAHVHIESSMLSPRNFAELVIPFGTGTVIADPHEIANVKGLDGIRYILESSKSSLLDVRIMLPSCVPALPFEDAGACLMAADLAELIEHEKVLGLGEMMDVFGVINQDKEVVDKINLAKQYGKLIDGHSPAIDTDTLDSYVLAGIKTDHECTNLSEVCDRLRRGMYVLLREGSAAHDLLNLLPAVNAFNAPYCLFCTDDRHVADIVKRGHINTLVRMAVEAGLEPIQAIRMASLNIAECYGLKGKGSLAVGMEASFMMVNSIKDFIPHAVFIKGKKVAEHGKMLDFVDEQLQKNAKELSETKELPVLKELVGVKELSELKELSETKELESLTLAMRDSINIVMPSNFDIPVASGKARLIKVCAHSLFTECEIASVGVDNNGNFDFSKNKGILKIAVIERHKKTGKIGLGLLHEQYGLKNGAIATSIAHDSHNIVVVGDNDADMFLAVHTLEEMGGGIVMTSQGKIIASLELSIAGLMSEEDGKNVAEKLEELLSLAKSHYHIWDKADAFMTLSFLALPVIPQLKITASGLFDMNVFSFVSVDACSAGR